ncbi:MAG: protein DA1 [Chloroflexia bacterium]
MRAARETRISAPGVRPRGRYCNMCGTRLERGGGLALFPSKHSIEWYDTSEGIDHAGRAATWSLCEECYADRLKCASCGLQVGTQAFMLEGETRVYCRHCFEERPRCDTCGAPVGAHYWNRTDGRKLCDRCQTTVVSDRKQAEALYDGVRATLMRLLGVTLRKPCGLQLVSRGQLLGLIAKSSLYSLDAESKDRCFGLFIREGKHRAIFVEYALPQIVLLEVMAHEYAHAWQNEHCRMELDPEIQEGFAEWMTYKLLQGWNCKKRMERMKRRDDIYGRGLKKMLQWESEGGIAEVFRRVQG